MKPTVRWSSFKDIDRGLQALKPAVAKRLSTKVLMDAGRPIAEDAASRVHVKEGDLRDSAGVGTKLTTRQRKLNKKESDLEVYVGFGGLPQAITEEFGTSKVTANPALEPAWDAGKDRALDSIKTGLATNIEKAANRAARKS